MDAFWAHQCPSCVSKTDGDLFRGPESPLVYHLSGWYSSNLFQGSGQPPWETWGCLQKLEEAGLKLKPSKCELFQRHLAYLGHVISAKGVATDEGKIEAIKNWPTPTNVMEVWSFLGFMGYYHRFISKFTQMACSLHKLTSGEIVGK